MRPLSLQLLIGLFILLNNACAILNYSPSDLPTLPLNETHDRVESLSLSYLQGQSKVLDSESRSLPWETQTIKDLFEHHSRYSKVIVTSNPPENGMHVNVYQTDGPVSSWCRASIWTLGIVPCYADGVVYTMHFDVLLHNTLKESYQYEMSRKGVQWLGLLPFFWVNLFTAQYKDAFSANAHQFIIDAQRDGYL
jgi:hypothetical protein